MDTSEIRTKFLEYFSQKGHTIVHSSPLTPKGDPTLLFANAGMVQFKRLFLGEEQRSYTRAVSVQKCLRVGGKHNDLENVGMTLRHHTFFEMLGNFSFGDYSKKEAILFAWEFLVEVMGLEPERLWATIFRDDDEAFKIWKEEIGFPEDRIIRMGEEDNFWSMGEIGPCGPCSEILIDQGADIGCGLPACAVGCSCDRYLELWNLVFMQYNRDSSGKLIPLPRPSIDTGMGLERLASVMQGVKGDYEIDLFSSLVQGIEKIANKIYGENDKVDFSLRVIADHSRAIAFLISEGIIPSNEGRGYILRRVIRRSARHGRLLDIEESFLSRVLDMVVSKMKNAYPELIKARDIMMDVVKGEEERFSETLDRGLILLSEEIETLKTKGERVVPGSILFKLYDTYGFPLDLTEEILREKGMELDKAGFTAALDRQRKRGKEAWKGDSEAGERTVYREIGNSGVSAEFVGYDHDTYTSGVTHIIKDGAIVEEASEGEKIGILVEATPFYGESGGQTGDKGVIKNNGFYGIVEDTARPATGIFLHLTTVKKGSIKIGETVELLVDSGLRKKTGINHTVTHILHSVLKSTIGEHVKQAGSLVTPDRLRFDYNHFASLSASQIYSIEDEVNRWIRNDLEVITNILSFEKALEEGATALFEEKYGKEVRVVEIEGLSKELCGGIHAKRTGEIGVFKLTSESAVASGIRRIEAVTGEKALEYIKDKERALDRVASLLKAGAGDIEVRLERLIEAHKALQSEVNVLKKREKKDVSLHLLNKAEEVDGVKVIASKIDAEGPEEMREVADRLRDGLGSGVVLLGMERDGKAVILIAVTKDLTSKFHAGKMIKELAVMVGGRGGGKPDMAQAGGKDPKGLDRVIKGIYNMVKGVLKN
ncbi:MAG: alanine--tRNA ligase [Thermodesulfobacteriota bacterium]